jgi:hypothetical protein
VNVLQINTNGAADNRNNYWDSGKKYEFNSVRASTAILLGNADSFPTDARSPLLFALFIVSSSSAFLHHSLRLLGPSFWGLPLSSFFGPSKKSCYLLRFAPMYSCAESPPSTISLSYIYAPSVVAFLNVYHFMTEFAIGLTHQPIGPEAVFVSPL